MLNNLMPQCRSFVVRTMQNLNNEKELPKFVNISISGVEAFVNRNHPPY